MIMPLTDMFLDPETLDFTDEDDGAWREIDDSRTAVRAILDIRFNEWCGNPSDGSRLRAMLEAQDPPPLPEDLVAEAERALRVLVNESLISSLVVRLDEDPSSPSGRVVLVASYVDLASGRPVDVVYSPFGG